MIHPKSLSIACAAALVFASCAQAQTPSQSFVRAITARPDFAACLTNYQIDPLEIAACVQRSNGDPDSACLAPLRDQRLAVERCAALSDAAANARHSETDCTPDYIFGGVNCTTN